ncbi:MAG TPA: hypothetical protein VLS85_14550, partial [Hanamia sp.]|nr:hypothetical protein [Hanamia sp.]
SSIDDALLFASIAHVKNLIIAHHDPSHSDERLSQIFKDIRLKTKDLFKFEMAEEGMVFDLP